MKATTTAGLLLLLAAPACTGPDSDGQFAEADHEEDSHQPADVVTLTPTAESTAAITVTVAGAATRATTTLNVPGRVLADPAREQVISSRIGGRLERLLASVGTRVQAGDAVAHIFAPDFLIAQEELILAGRRARALAATSDSGIARDILAAAARRLLQLGADPALVDRLASDGAVQPYLVVRAPSAGSLVEQGPPPGSAVASGEMLFRLVDLTEVDVVASVPERAIPSLRIGMAGHVVIPALGSGGFPGRLERIRDQLDIETRTIDAVLHVANPGGVLRPGMFADVVLELPGSAQATLVSVPEASVLVDGADRIAFVRIGEHTYQRRVILLAELPVTRDGRVLVAEGLTPGDSVVVRGAFTLKSELAKATLAEDHH